MRAQQQQQLRGTPRAPQLHGGRWGLPRPHSLPARPAHPSDGQGPLWFSVSHLRPKCGTEKEVIRSHSFFVKEEDIYKYTCIEQGYIFDNVATVYCIPPYHFFENHTAIHLHSSASIIYLQMYHILWKYLHF